MIDVQRSHCPGTHQILFVCKDQNGAVSHQRVINDCLHNNSRFDFLMTSYSCVISNDLAAIDQAARSATLVSKGLS